MSRNAFRVASSLCLFALAACSGGGGAATPVTNTTPTANNTPAPSTATETPPAPPVANNTPAPPPTVSIVAPRTSGTGGFGSSGTNFTNDPPAVGFSFKFLGTLTRVAPTVVDAPTNAFDATMTWRGTVTSGGVVYPVFDFSVPSLSINATNVRGDGTPVSLSNGTLLVGTTNMTYTMLGAWAFVPSGGGMTYVGQSAVGYITQSLPTTGAATYTASAGAPGGGVRGVYYVPSGTGTVSTGALLGDASINVNFGANTVSGAFTNMKAIAAEGGATTQWNDVNLTGTLTRVNQPTSASFQGTTNVASVPPNPGPAVFAGGADGVMMGSFYGPAAAEVGGVWTLAESPGTNGKAAIGTFGAKK